MAETEAVLATVYLKILYLDTKGRSWL